MIDPSLIGWLAAGLTLLTFSMRSMLWLRISALAANVCFIAYGALAELAPVLVLHLLLLPCNLVRLGQLNAEAGGSCNPVGRLAVIRTASTPNGQRSAAVPSGGDDGRDWLLVPGRPRGEGPPGGMSRASGAARNQGS